MGYCDKCSVGKHFILADTLLACVQRITKLWLVPSAKQCRDPCSGPPTDSTNYRKCVSNSPSTWLAITTNKTKPFLTGQSWRVLKSGYTAGSPEQGFRRCFADGVNQSLISSARRLVSQRSRERIPYKPEFFFQALFPQLQRLRICVHIIWFSYIQNFLKKDSHALYY